MIPQFIKTCREKGEKPAFIDRKKRVSFSELLSDVYRMTNLFEAKGLSEDSKVLLLVPPSYEFYVLLFACICYGINVVVPDSYRDFNRIRETAKENGVRHVFCNSVTALFKCRFPSDFVFVNISGYRRQADSPRNKIVDNGKTVLTTFTSGTTGTPKPIERSIADLQEQINVVSKNIPILETDTVYAKLPIYVLFVVYSGLTCIISRRMKGRELSALGVNAVLLPIAKLLQMNEVFPFIEKTYFGGAMLYEKDARKLQALFPNAKSTYIYGSSECVLMAKADLDHYLAHSFAMGSAIEGVTLSICDKDKNGIGKIKAIGEVVLTESHEFVGNDLGYFDEHGLHIVGRSRYSVEGHYNYLTDDRILKENPKVKRGFSFVHKEAVYFCYEGTLSKKDEGIVYIRFRRLPMDPKHRTKLDYRAVIRRIDATRS